MAGGAIKPLSDGDTRIVLFDPSRTARWIVTDHLRYKASVRIYEQSTFEIVVPMVSPVWTTTYSGASASSTEWANWSFDYYFRGTRKFSGPVVAGAIEEEGIGRPGTTPVAYATLVCESWLAWLLSGRTIQTATGGDWAMTSTTWDNIARQLIRDQCSSSYVTPPSYPGSTPRSGFGPFTVTVEANSSTAASGDYSIQAGKPLAESLFELCSTPPTLDTNGLWPKMTETSPGTFQFGVLVGRGGGSRGIGTDKSASVVVAGQFGTMRHVKYTWDHKQIITVGGIGGTKRGANRRRSWQKDSTLHSTFGVREDELDVPGAVNAADREAELRRMMNEANSTTSKTWEFALLEREGTRYAVDFDDKDTITAACRSNGRTITEMVIGADIEATAPDAASVKLIFGSYPRDPVRDAQRSGGGGRGGGKRGGNKPKDSDGRSENDPDDALSVKDFYPDRGDSPVTIDTINDRLDIKRNSTGNGGDQTYPNITILGVAGANDKILVGMIGTRTTGVFCKTIYWWPVEIDTDGDGDPDVVYYVPLYDGPACGSPGGGASGPNPSG